tara:strand:- start:1576 stop:1746 length:171 start_codon:yes stop_codon:yes gene_type:complete
MLYRLGNGRLVEIKKNDFTSDKLFYQKIYDYYNINNNKPCVDIRESKPFKKIISLL